jgi:transposase
MIPAGLTVIQVLPTPDTITIVATSDASTAACPSCGRLSRRVHSTYHRRLQDLPWQGRAVVIRVRARRFRCPDLACVRRTFAEPLSGATVRRSWRTCRLGDLQRHIGLAAGGEAGSRLARRLAMPVSPATLLRLVARSPEPVTPVPKVLAVDEWAWRKGHRYGTVLVDLERNRVVDLLPDRRAETFSTWLREHPGVEVIARDRAGAYADGAAQGAPEVVQVADRWHLLRNVGDALRHAVERHHAALRRIAREVAAELAAERVAGEPASKPEPVPTALERRRAEARARRQARHDEAVRLREGGATLAAIAAALGTPPRTLAYWLTTGHAPLRDRGPAGSILDPFRDYLERRYAEGCRNARQLWRELRAQGFQGRPTIVRVWIGRWNKAGSGGAPTATSSHPGWRLPSVHAVTRLLTSDRDSAPDRDQRLCARLLEEVPELAAAADAARRLARVLRKEGAEPLADVLGAMKGTLLDSLATSLERDAAAVQAALDTSWTTSPAEGQINKLKTLKRAMYGRAGFPLLRARVLHAA